MRPRAMERMILILTLIVFNGVYLNYIYTQIPSNGDYVPLVSKLITFG